MYDLLTVQVILQFFYKYLTATKVIIITLTNTVYFFLIYRFLGTNLKWGLIKYPRMRLKRNVLFGFTDVLGT